MNLVFLKVDKIDNGVIVIPPGGARFTFRDKEIATAESLQLEVDRNGNFANVIRGIECELFTGQALTGVKIRWSLHSLVSNESFEKAIFHELNKQYFSERELVALEMMGGGVMPVSIFEHLDDLKARYQTLHTPSLIKFEGRTYKHVDTTVEGVKRTRKYRCEDEQHSLYILLFSDLVVDVCAKYEINEVIPHESTASGATA